MPDRYNKEGYPDPTVYEAMLNIGTEGAYSRFRPVVFICCPRDQNAARRYSRFAVDEGCLPIAPLLLFSQFMEATEKDTMDFMSMVLLSKCAELWVFGDETSNDMKRQIARARYRHMPVRYFTTDCGVRPI